MGVYADYLDRTMSFQDLSKERKVQLERISRLRGGRDVIVYASDGRKHKPPTVSASIDGGDLLPFADQLSNMKGAAIDVVLDTPGGYAEVAEDMVRQLRDKYADVAFVIPGSAKSAGTIMVMSGNEILMGPGSSLGPIDAQLSWQGKVFSAEAFLEGLKKIKDETEQKQALNRALIPMLQNISPGEIQHAENALQFARTLVTDWLARYKFEHWKTHSSTGAQVTPEERLQRAGEIAAQLCNHSHWLTHSRSIKMTDLVAMRLKVTNYALQAELADAIVRYHTLLQMTFEGTQIYKVFETPTSQIYRFSVPEGQQKLAGAVAQSAVAQLKCNRCQKDIKLQLDFVKGLPLQNGCLRYPKNDTLACPKCKASQNVGQLRQQIEARTKREVVR